LLLYAGRLSPEKNVGLLIEMLERLVDRCQTTGGGDFRLVIAGDGPLAGELRAAARARVPGRTLFVGAIADVNQLATYYASADVFVHPNPREPFGIAPLEAMASGVPVVLPDTGGVLSYATPENAWQASPTAECFASAVWDATTARDDRRILNAQRTAQTHDWPRVAARWFAMYDELIHHYESTTRFDRPGHGLDSRDPVSVRAALGTKRRFGIA
jgi:glycosyltransferase involved in cell wall biosynthesis